MRGFTREKLADDPPKIAGWRTVAAGKMRVRMAILPDGKAKAVALYKPKPKRRNPEPDRGNLGGLAILGLALLSAAAAAREEERNGQT